jgi:hypothetical protein
MRDSGGLGAGLTGLMAKKSDHLAGTFETENTGGVLSGLLAEENEFDRASLWRIGSWGAGAVAAVVIAVMANQTSLGMRRDQLAAADLTRQAERLQALTRESQNETRRLASAIDTLNNDRDRLYSRVTVLEQGLDSVTGAIARQNSATAPTQDAAAKPSTDASSPTQPVAPGVAPVTSTVAPATTVLAKSDPAPKPDPAPKMGRPRTDAKPIEQSPAIASPAPPAPTAPAATPPTPATPLMAAKSMLAPPDPVMAAKSMLAPPDPGAQKLIEPEKPVVAKAEDSPAPNAMASAAQTQPEASDSASLQAAVQRTEFAVDIGSANSIGGLRALWRGLTKSNPELVELHPIIIVRESATGLGMQLRLAAGPLTDAAAAAKICAALIESQRTCETTVYDGQRLAMKADEPPLPAVKPAPPTQQQQSHRRNYYPKRAKNDDSPAKPESSTLSRWFGRDTSKQ